VTVAPSTVPSAESVLQGNLGQLFRLKQQNRHLKTLLSVGGYSYSGNFLQPASSSKAVATFAQSVVDIVRNYGFDGKNSSSVVDGLNSPAGIGVDIDWEYPGSGRFLWYFSILLLNDLTWARCHPIFSVLRPSERNSDRA
jgi:GH18 family chitinase